MIALLGNFCSQYLPWKVSGYEMGGGGLALVGGGLALFTANERTRRST